MLSLEILAKSSGRERLCSGKFEQSLFVIFCAIKLTLRVSSSLTT